MYFTAVFCDIVQVNTKVSDALVNDIFPFRPNICIQILQTNTRYFLKELVERI